jgi:hypothetical protein
MNQTAEGKFASSLIGERTERQGLWTWVHYTCPFCGLSAKAEKVKHDTGYYGCAKWTNDRMVKHMLEKHRPEIMNLARGANPQ